MIPEIKPVVKKPTQRIQFPLSTPAQRAAAYQRVEGFKDYTGKDPQAVAPISFETVCEGRQIYLSKPYSHNGYPVIFAYVEKEKGELAPRLLYHSYSRAQWRVAPTTRSKFGKGYMSDIDVNLTPLLNIALSHQFKDAIAKPKELDTHDELPGFIAGFTAMPDRGLEADKDYQAEIPMNFSAEKKVAEYPAEAFEKKRSVKAVPPPGSGFKLKGETLPPGFKLKDKSAKKGAAHQVGLGFIAKKKKVTGTLFIVDASMCPLKSDEGFIPDFESGMVFKTTVNNPFYQTVLQTEAVPDNKMTLYCVLSKDKQYQYLIADCKNKDGAPYRFVLTVANHPSDMTSFLVPKQFLSLGHRMVYPVVRGGEELLTMHKPEINMRRPDLYNPMTPTRDLYIDITPYAAKLPMNAYLNSLPTLDYTHGHDETDEPKRPGVK